MFHKIGKKYRETALIKLIIVGLILGIIIALAAPQAVPAVSVLGDLFVRALKGIAPVLVFVLVMNALAQKNSDASASMKPIVRLYVFATFCASLVAVAYSFAFPTVLHLQVADAEGVGRCAQVYCGRSQMPGQRMRHGLAVVANRCDIHGVPPRFYRRSA